MINRVDFVIFADRTLFQDVEIISASVNLDKKVKTAGKS